MFGIRDINTMFNMFLREMESGIFAPYPQSGSTMKAALQAEPAVESVVGSKSMPKGMEGQGSLFDMPAQPQVQTQQGDLFADAGYSSINDVEHTYRVVRSSEELRDMVGRLEKNGIFAFDTETTGMDIEAGNRLISIGCVEIVGRSITKRTFYKLIDPEREVEEGAAKVHGYTWDKLKGKPYFVDIVDDFLAFIKGSQLIIHNAAFDVAYLNMELARLGKGPITDYCEGVLDTLPLAKSLRPGQRVSLDALCSAYGINNTDRTLHGALIDAKLLAQVYLAMTRGQESLDITSVDMKNLPPMPDVSKLRVVKASAEEEALHLKTLQAIDKESKGNLVWKTEADTEQSAS